MTNNTEQQAVPVAQGDREAAAALDDALGFLTDLERPIVEQAFARHRLAPHPCKSGEGADHGLGPHATVVDDCEDGFMSVAIVVGENVYLAQGGEQITMSREQFAEIAKTSTDATQTREAEDEAHLRTIDERDAAEAALSDAYRAVCGCEPAWSNLFSYEDAVSEMRDAARGGA